MQLSSSLTTVQWAYLSWRGSESISEKWTSHFQSSHTLQTLESEPDSCDVTLASKDGYSFPQLILQQLHMHLTFDLPSLWQPSQPGYPLPCLRTGFDNFSLTFGCLHWQLQHQHQLCQHHLLRPCTLNTNIGLPVPCLSSEPSLPDQAQAASTASSASSHHHKTSIQHVTPYCIMGGAIVINLFSNRNYLCVIWRAGGSANRLPLLENPKGLLSRINHWLIDWLHLASVEFESPPPSKTEWNDTRI